MTHEDFQFMLETMRSYSFEAEGRKWEMFYEKKSDGSVSISLGEEYLVPVYFDSFGSLFADAMIGNHYFRKFVLSLEK